MAASAVVGQVLMILLASSVGGAATIPTGIIPDPKQQAGGTDTRSSSQRFPPNALARANHPDSGGARTSPEDHAFYDLSDFDHDDVSIICGVANEETDLFFLFIN